MLLITVATIASPFSRPFALHLAAAHQQHGVAVHDRGRGDRRRSRDRRRRRRRRPCGSRARRTACASRSGCVDPHSQVDVAAVRLVADHDDVEAEIARTAAAPPSSSRRWRSRSPASAGQAAADPAATAAQMIEVGVDDIGRSARGAGAVRRRSSRRRRRSLRPRARRASVNFSPRPENTLMPLSSNGLCDAEITMPASNALARVR